MSGTKGKSGKYKRTLEMIESIRLGHLGQKVTEGTRRKMSENNARYWLGKSRSDESKAKFRQRMLGTKGEKSPAWRGGLTPQNKIIRGSNEYVE